MNVFKYLNSNSVANYLKLIDYKFSAQEIAFIIKRSRKLSFDEKIKAWSEIIDTMPDCPVVCRFDYPKYPSLRKFLKDHIALLRKVGEGADENSLKGDDFKLLTAFDFMWFRIPAPFKKGDIVYNPRSMYSNENQPFVLTNLSCWDEQDYRANGYTERDYNFKSIAKRLADVSSHDCSDMSAHGYLLREGILDYDWLWNYLDFEYYDKELAGNNRILLALSNYFKGKLDLEKFLNAYLLIRNEESIDGDMVFTDEELSLVGLKK